MIMPVVIIISIVNTNKNRKSNFYPLSADFIYDFISIE